MIQQLKDKRSRSVRQQKAVKVASIDGVRFLDRVCLIFSVLMPATAIPQVFKIIQLQDASSVSLLMWVLYAVGILPFLIYGIVHRMKEIILLNALWTFVNILMIVLILYYS